MGILEIKPWTFLTASSLSLLGGIVLAILILKSINFRTVNLEETRKGFLVNAIVFSLVGAVFGFMGLVTLLDKDALMLVIMATLAGFCFFLGIGSLLCTKIISNKKEA